MSSSNFHNFYIPQNVYILHRFPQFIQGEETNLIEDGGAPNIYFSHPVVSARYATVWFENIRCRTSKHSLPSKSLSHITDQEYYTKFREDDKNVVCSSTI